MRYVAVIIMLTVALAGVGPASAQTRVSNFGLKNQNDQYTEVNFPSDRPVILIFGDRKGAEQIAGWSKPLMTVMKRVYIFGIASLTGVPRSHRTGATPYKTQTSYPVLLDWAER